MPHQRLTKYNPCHCGSGLFYVHCHKSIDEAAPSERLNAAHIQYRVNWTTNLRHFMEAGISDWMACKLKRVAPTRVLDIGTGTGEGLEASLRAYNPVIVSIDENRAHDEVFRTR